MYLRGSKENTEGHFVIRMIEQIHLAEQRLPKIGGTAEFGWGHDGPPLGGYRGTWGG